MTDSTLLTAGPARPWKPSDGAVGHGGGIQTTALLIAAGRGIIGYRTFLFANVGDDSEDPGTLIYLREIAKPYAEAHGIEIHELRRRFAQGDRAGQVETLYGRLVNPIDCPACRKNPDPACERCGGTGKAESRSLPIPVRMADEGAPGMRSCTKDFKIRVCGAWLKARGACEEDPAELAMGISLDEIERANHARREPYERLAYPLVGLLAGEPHDFGFGRPLRRVDCERMITSEPLPGGPGGQLAARLRELAGQEDGDGEPLLPPVTRSDLLASGFSRMPRPPKSACWFPVSGDTEVVTRQGIRPIAALAGGRADLLVPAVGTRGGLAETGTWQSCEVRNTGVQPLRRVTLTRGRSRKVVHATGEHRWVLKAGPQWAEPGTLVRTTDELRPGDRLKTLRAVPPATERISPFGIMHGFVYGDGDRPQGNRGCGLTLYARSNGKVAAMLPLFAAAAPKPRDNGDWYIYGLPRAWKRPPDLAEHRGYLLGWLAGYFAADGSVAKGGSMSLSSASEASILAARDVCAILGVGYSPVRSRRRQVTLSGRAYDSVLYEMAIDRHTVPAGFLLLPDHARRAIEAPAGGRRNAWTVESVEETSRVEPVYCAVVPGAQAFALADELMTGNCPLHRVAGWRQIRRDRPAMFDRACALEERLNVNRRLRGRDMVYLTRYGKPLAEAIPAEPDDLFAAAAEDAGDGECDNGYCFI